MARQSLLVAFLLLQACGSTRLRALPDPADQPDQGQQTITRRLAGMTVTIEVETTGPEPTIFGLELGLQFNPERDLRDIRQLALPREPIPPGERAEGFIYFPKPPRDARRLTLLLTVDAPSGQHELSFSYTIYH